MKGNENMERANEVHAAYISNEEALQDKALFVHNLGELLSQTRCSITGAELKDEDTVIIRYKCGYEDTVNIRHDSYLAIIRDVCKNI